MNYRASRKRAELNFSHYEPRNLEKYIKRFVNFRVLFVESFSLTSDRAIRNYTKKLDQTHAVISSVVTEVSRAFAWFGHGSLCPFCIAETVWVNRTAET